MITTDHDNWGLLSEQGVIIFADTNDDVTHA